MQSNFILKLAPLRYTAFFFSVFLLCCTYWLNRKFGVVTLDQIIYHFEFGADGLLSGDSDFFYSFLKGCILPPVALIFIIWIGRFSSSKMKHPYQSHFLQVLSFPIKYGVVIFFLSSTIFFYNVSAINSIKSRFTLVEDFFTPNYLDPRSAEIKAENPKNLVLIYVESLENTYEDTALFGKNLLAPLHNLSSDNTLSFKNFVQMPGTGWTIAGIVGTQCGVPLKSMTIFDQNKQSENLKHFLPRAVCLGDILAAHGYKNIYMRGADMKFAGADKFFSSHGYVEITGKNEWLSKGYTQKDMNKWGLYDDTLFFEAKKRLSALVDEGQRFNFTLLTLDTHHPKGNLNSSCAKKGYSEFKDIVLCSNEQVADFVKFIHENGWSENISIVIMGDHLAMKNPVYKELQSSPERTIFNLFYGHDINFTKSRDAVTHFDMYPTLLEFIGFNVSGGKLGLGYSAIATSHDSIIPPPEGYYASMRTSLLNRSETYNQLWKAN